MKENLDAITLICLDEWSSPTTTALMERNNKPRKILDFHQQHEVCVFVCVRVCVRVCAYGGGGWMIRV